VFLGKHDYNVLLKDTLINPNTVFTALIHNRLYHCGCYTCVHCTFDPMAKLVSMYAYFSMAGQHEGVSCINRFLIVLDLNWKPGIPIVHKAQGWNHTWKQSQWCKNTINKAITLYIRNITVDCTFQLTFHWNVPNFGLNFGSLLQSS
jgi:hypothetical protein